MFTTGSRPERMTWTDDTYARYVSEICAVGTRMRSEMVNRRIARPQNEVKSGQTLTQSILAMRQEVSSLFDPATEDRNALGPFGPQAASGDLFIHPNGFISSQNDIVIALSSLDRRRRWDENPRLVAPRKAIKKNANAVRWYDGSDLIEFCRPLVLPLFVSMPELLSEAETCDSEVRRFINSDHVVVATDIDRIGHVWDYGWRPDVYRTGQQIGKSDFYFESLQSYFGRVLALEVLIAGREQ
jgi:hypothetical protein